MSFFKKFFGKNKPQEEVEKIEQELDKGLEKTKTGFFNKITKAIAGKATVDEDAGRISWSGDGELGERAARNLRFTM